MSRCLVGNILKRERHCKKSWFITVISAAFTVTVEISISMASNIDNTAKHDGQK